MLITRASGEGRRLFSRPPRRWASLVIVAGVALGAVCLLAPTSDRDPVELAAKGCVVVAAATVAVGLLFRILSSRPF